MRVFASLLMIVFLAGCANAAKHRAQVQDDSADTLTVGRVQKEIRVGMSGADVASILGSPNIVTTDDQRREVWVYDKVASDVTYSQSSGFATLILLGYAKDAGAASTTQRTLTVVIKFDENKKVRDFAYHSSKF